MKSSLRMVANRLGTGALVVLLAFSINVTSVPGRAYAQLVVNDPPNTIQSILNLAENAVTAAQTSISAFFNGQLNIKEYVLDPLATMAKETVRQAILRSIINWANSGFEGSPAFVTNIKKNLRGLGDHIADSFLAELSESGVINSPFKSRVIRELRLVYRRATSDRAFFETNRYTLDRYSDDPEALIRGDLAHGGLRGWAHLWLNQQNNPIGAFGAARKELEGRILSAVSDRRDELGRNGGFLDFCVPARANPAATPPPPQVRNEGDPTTPAAGGTSLRPAIVGCKPGESVRTLGSLTHESVKKALGSDIDSIISADELNEVFGAILNGVFMRTFKAGGGFGGLSEASSGGGRAPIDDVGASGGTLQASGGFLSAADGQLSQLKDYKSNWERIKGAANQAKENCQNGSSAGKEIESVIASSTAAITKVEGVIAEFEAAKVKISATDEKTQREGVQAYQAILNSGKLPTLAEITYASAQSKDRPNATPPTLYTRMMELSRGSCST